MACKSAPKLLEVSSARRLYLGLVMLLATATATASDLNLTGTIWERVADAYRVDPYLLYSIALVESSVYRGRKTTSPWPWVINTPGGPRYANSQHEANRELTLALSRYPARRVDVGIMQVSAGWHGGRVGQLSDLLDPEINLRTAAAILVEAMSSSPNDATIAIGRYHSGNPTRARAYGRRVLNVYSRIAP
jgi:soluble lytic murein transglycosylase-like protein